VLKTIQAQNLNRFQSLSVIKSLTREAFEAEPEELKDAIRQEAEAQNASVDSDPKKHTPESYCA
jgi:hypothetical protein